MSLPSTDVEKASQVSVLHETRLLQSSNRQDALEHAINAAEASVQALKLSLDPHEKARHSARFKQLLEQAEKIKYSNDWREELRPLASRSADRTTPTPAANRRARLLKEPQSTRHLPKSEQILLLKAGFLNSCKFPPWSGPPTPGEFQLIEGEDLYEDAPELALSDFQESVFEGWQRPQDALPPPSWFPAGRSSLGPSMTASRKKDLVQDAATDCSVVASLCAAVARAERGHAKILQVMMHPYDIENDHPQMAPNGKYIIRLNFNGCYRRVVIDDRLPVSNTNRVIHVVDRHNPGLLWPALVEKAYLKIRGGYDFVGSNSSTDLWILTGWIPEQVFLQSDDLELNRLWNRISSASAYGDVLVTLGTGKMSPRTERELGLAGEHDYAVLDLREVDGQRLMLVKNPWFEGTSWRGRFNGNQQNTASSSNHENEEVLSDLDADTEPVQRPRDLLNSDEQLSPGTFWMDLDNILQYFESIYLNWNPGLFSHRQDLHFAWDLAASSRDGHRARGPWASLMSHPQFTVTAGKGGTIWLLLSRHLKNSIPANATDEEIEAGHHYIDMEGHISLATFSSAGRRVLLAEKPLERGWLVDSPQTLLKLDDCEAATPYTIVPLEENLTASEHTFTLSAFSRAPLELAEAKIRYQYANTLKAAWTKETAGGNAQSPIYTTNPQFSIAVPQKTSISLVLETSRDELYVHVKLVHSKGQRVHTVGKKDIVFDSKDYRRGCCVAEFAGLESGQYTIICSTFEANQLADFLLLIESDQPTRSALLPREGAGRLRMELSAVGFKRGENKIAAPIEPKRLVKFYAIAHYLDTAASGHGSQQGAHKHSLLRMSVEIDQGLQRRVLTASANGEYIGADRGIRTDDLDLSPEMKRYGDMWLVIDRMCVNSDAQEERLSVELFVDQPDSVICGVWRHWDDD